MSTDSQMEILARISKEWRRRMLFMFFMLFGMGSWFLSDGYIYWPNEGARYQEFSKIADELIESGKATDAESSSVRLAWQRYAKEVDYRTGIPSERKQSDIHDQRVIGWFILIGSLLFGLWICWNHTRSVRTEGELVMGASGEKIQLDDIIEIDRKKWAKKGIVYGIYVVKGKRRRLTLDDHKFAGCEAIILEAERRIKERSASSQRQES
jgi:hypothetical protein